MKVFIAFMFLLTSVTAQAEIPLPEFIQPSPAQDLDSACRKGVAKADGELVRASALDEKAKIDVGRAASAPVTGQANQGTAQTTISATAAKANAEVVQAYTDGLTACTGPCDASMRKNIELQGNGSGSEGDAGVTAADRAKFKKNAEEAQRSVARCQEVFSPRIALAKVAAVKSGADAATAVGVTAAATTGTPTAPPEGESWFQRNGAWVVGAGLVGVGAAALLSNSGGSSGGQQYQNSPSPSPSPTPATGTGTVCTTEAEATTTTCAATFVTNCTANPAGAGCATFTSNYCGLADASSVTPSGSGAGNKTTYCRSVVSTRFCAQTGTSACVTCEYQAQMSKAICKTNIENNPTLCASQNTQTQIDAKKAACPSDPVYADNSILQTTAPNAGLDAPVLPTGTTSTVTGTGSGTGTGVYTGKYYSSDAEKKSGLAASSASGTASRGVASTGSTSVSSGGYGSYATASVYKGAASEITPTMGRNLFDKNSKTLQNWCYSVQCRNVGAAAN